MAEKVSFKHKRKEAPEWVFSWRPPGESSFPKAFALLVVGGLFALLITSVRIRVTPPAPWATRKASVIHVTDDAEGRALTLRAREGGPFPSRFDPAAWEGALTLENAAIEAARWVPPPYQPVLRELPEDVSPPVSLAAKDESVLPKRRRVADESPVTGNLKLAPVLYARSGILPAAMPRELPAYDGPVADAMTASPWSFLVHLDAAGTVQDCISLVGGEGNDASPLESWLRRVSFNPEPAKTSRWIAVAVGFTNQATDGTDAR